MLLSSRDCKFSGREVEGRMVGEVREVEGRMVGKVREVEGRMVGEVREVAGRMGGEVRELGLGRDSTAATPSSTLDGPAYRCMIKFGNISRYVFKVSFS